MADDTSGFITAAETARRFGVTSRTLRVYEEKGLLAPQRTEAGWRVYGPREFERLYQILTFKRFGLSLRRIGEVLARREAGLDSLLARQEDALVRQLDDVRTVLASVREARAHLKRHGGLGTDSLVQLMKGVEMTDWQSKLNDMARETLSPEQERALAARMPDQAELNRVQAAWTEIFAEAEHRVGTDPSGPEAAPMAERALELLRAFSAGDPGLEANAGRAWKRGFENADMAARMPVSAEGWAFLQAAMAAHRKE